jgi:hypothetical protein
MREAVNSGRLDAKQYVQEQQDRVSEIPQPQRATGDPVETVKRSQEAESLATAPTEIGGPKGAEPTRFGDWERAGRCIDF